MLSEVEALEILRELGGRASTAEILRVARERGWTEAHCRGMRGTLRRLARQGVLQVDRKADLRCYVYQLIPPEPVSPPARSKARGAPQ